MFSHFYIFYYLFYGKSNLCFFQEKSRWKKIISSIATTQRKPPFLFWYTHSFPYSWMYYVTIFFFQKWADAVYAVLKTVFLLLFYNVPWTYFPCTWVKVPYLKTECCSWVKAAGNREWHLKQSIRIRLKHIARQMPTRESRVSNILTREIRIEGQRH